MFDNENQDEDLNVPGTRRVPSFESGSTEDFEASLGSLRPRSDGLDRRWRFLLAQEAALNGRLPESDVLAAGQFVCVRCGGVVSSLHHEKRSWAWPMAFSGMSAVAAWLFVMLLVRSGPQTAMPAGEPILAMPSTSVPADQTNSASWSLGGYGLSQRSVSGSAEAPYLDLRDQVLRYGVDSWRLPASAVAAAKIADPPRSYREQLDRLLKQESFRGS